VAPDGGRAGVAVLALDARGVAILVEDLLVPDRLAVGGAEAQGAQRLAAVVGRYGGGEIKFSPRRHRRAPTQPGNLLFPGDVFVLAPFQRKLGTAVDALPGRPAELRPIIGEQVGGRDRNEQEGGERSVHARSLGSGGEAGISGKDTADPV